MLILPSTSHRTTNEFVQIQNFSSKYQSKCIIFVPSSIRAKIVIIHNAYCPWLFLRTTLCTTMFTASTFLWILSFVLVSVNSMSTF